VREERGTNTFDRLTQHTVTCHHPLGTAVDCLILPNTGTLIVTSYRGNRLFFDTALYLRIPCICKVAAGRVQHAGGIYDHSGAISDRSFTDIHPSHPRI